MRIQSFQGLIPTEKSYRQVVAPPYDVINTEEAKKIVKGNESSLLHVSRPEVDFPEGTNPYSDEVYEYAASYLQKLQNKKALVREASPSLYIYRQIMGDHSQLGVVALCHVDDYLEGVIKKHEKTRPEKEDDRTRLTHETQANIGPVFLTYKNKQEIDELVQEVIEEHPPLFDFQITSDKVKHTLWRVPANEAFTSAFSKVPCAYVADGHHRSASAARVGTERKLANPSHQGDENYNWFLTVLFPDNQLQILPYNRLIQDLNGLSQEDFLEKVKASFHVSETKKPKPVSPQKVCMYLGEKWYELYWEDLPQETDVADTLDVSVLQNQLLAPILGIDDPRTHPKISFVGGIRGTDVLEESVRSGKAAVAFSMHPVTIDQLLAISDADQIMPPKSTWFEPKLRSGLFIHTL